MKMKDEHYATLVQLLDDLVASTTIVKLHQHREALKGDPKVKDLEMRFRWDLLYSANKEAMSALTRELYTYLNDDHIDTALRRYVSERKFLTEKEADLMSTGSREDRRAQIRRAKDGFSLFTWRENEESQDERKELHFLNWADAYRRMKERLDNGDLEYACPDCGDTGGLRVVVSASAKLVQGSDGNLETDVDGDHEWDDTSTMSCTCGKIGKVADFRRT